MGKTLLVFIGFIFLVSCSSTIDNHNISMTYYQNGEQKILSLKPDDEFIEEADVNGEKIYTDKLGRWTQTKPDKVLYEDADGRQLVEDGATGKTVWKIHDLQGNVKIEDFYASINDAGTRTSIEMNKHPIQYQDFGHNQIWSDHKLNDTHPENYKFKLVNGKIPKLPSGLGAKYKVDDPFFITFNSLDEGWSKYKKITDGKVITYGREIQNAFFSSKYQVNFAYSKDDDKPTLFRYDNVDVEQNSYWVEKKVGSFKPFCYKARPCKEMRILRSDHFKDDVKKYVESTFKPIWLKMVFNGEASTSPRTFAESARIAMVPLGRKVWAIFVGSQNGTADPFIDEIWTFSVVQFDSEKPVLRAWGQKTETETGTWSTWGQQKFDDDWADPEGMMQLYGVFDANLDGYKDYVFRWIGMGSATEDSYRILVVSLTDKGFCEIVPEYPLRDFYGLDGNKPLFQLGSFGVGQLFSTFYQQALASWRWNRRLMKVAEVRSDGNFILYHTSTIAILKICCKT